jgi:chromosome segregation ATPase
MSSSDARLVDFAQARVNRIADAIDGLAEQIKLTNSHVERLNPEVGELRTEVGELRTEVGSLRTEMRAGFDRVDHELRDIRGEVILQANQIINAQQQAMRATMRLDDIEQRPDEPKP